jgi:hypothetical protein
VRVCSLATRSFFGQSLRSLHFGRQKKWSCDGRLKAQMQPWSQNDHVATRAPAHTCSRASNQRFSEGPRHTANPDAASACPLRGSHSRRRARGGLVLRTQGRPFCRVICHASPATAGKTCARALSSRVPLQITCNMMLGMRAFLVLLMLLVCASAQAQSIPPTKTMVQGEVGGRIDWHWYRFKALDYSGNQIEVHGRCRSACLCFAEGAFLGFHWAREGSWDGPPSRSSTQWLMDHYPADIRAWLDNLGGIDKLPKDGYWVLPASTLWAMGYRRCAP